ncbi:MAG: hypothetical protein VW547_13850, partial [Alphaproteobacteria bacterium]
MPPAQIGVCDDAFRDNDGEKDDSLFFRAYEEACLVLQHLFPDVIVPRLKPEIFLSFNPRPLPAATIPIILC